MLTFVKFPFNGSDTPQINLQLKTLSAATRIGKIRLLYILDKHCQKKLSFLCLSANKEKATDGLELRTYVNDNLEK